MPIRRHPRFTLQRLAALAVLALTLPALTGCVSLFVSKRKLLVPIAPATVQTASADQLVASMNQSWDKFQSMTAAVDIQASHLKAREGVATDYPTFRANLLLSKPNKLRILGRTPLVQTTMFDLASDGTNFTLVIPHNNVVYHGLNSSKGTSPNWYENLRPGFLFNAMVVRGVEQDELYSVTSESITEEDAASKHLLLHPEYVLNIVRRKPNSQELFPVRVVRFHREDLLPYEQDLYDDAGVMETQVIYGPYKDFEGAKYPGTITLKRPQDEYQLVMTVERVVSNPTLTDDQFQAVIPKGSTVKEMQ
jgi:outer membrane lipoprotein-sorting protein